MDKILIKDLQARCIIGVNADERREKQDVIVNIVLCADTRRAGESDRFEDAVDYRAVKKRIIAMVESSQFFLVEALAERIAAMCLEDSRVRQAQVTVEKPSALRFAQRWRGDRPRQARMSSAIAFISVGSNIEPERNIPAAIAALTKSARILAVSTFYETRPLGPAGQPAFYNGVVEIATSLAPRPLKFDVLRKIESDLGRRRTGDKYAARPIDLDILAYDQLAIAESDLSIPDADIPNRPFLAVPLAELAPELVLPGLGSVAALAARHQSHDMRPLPDFTSALRKLIELRL